MKNLSKLMGLLWLALLFQNCSQKDDIAPAKEKIQFTFNLGSAAGGRVSSQSLPSGTSIRLTIRKSTGETVKDLQSLEIVTMGGGIISAPVELAVGSYTVTDFLLVNTSGIVTHATPKAGSVMAALVVNPLGRSFSVNSGSSVNVPMEVVEISKYAASDFGYSTFDLTVIHPLKISVFGPATGGGWKHISASAYVLNGADTLQQLSIGAKITLVPFNQNTDSTFTLLIIRDGYARYTQTFNYHDIVTSLNGQVLKIYMTPAFTILTNLILDGGYQSDVFSALMEYPKGATLTVDWGDGTTEVLDQQGLGHIYTNSRKQNFITITGDIDKITLFDASEGWGIVEQIDFSHLTDLKNLTMNGSRKPQTIDLTHNTKIEYMNFEFIQNTKTILLPTVNKLNYVDLNFGGSYTQATLSAVIDKVYNSAVADNRHGGTFMYVRDVDSSLVWKLTPTAKSKLQTLRDVYGWHIAGTWDELYPS